MLLMRGVTSSYAVDPRGESVIGLVEDGAMRVVRARQRHVVRAGELCAWDPSAAHSGRPYGAQAWAARVMVLEPQSLTALLDDGEAAALALRFGRPVVADRAVGVAFRRAHRALEDDAVPTLARDVLLGDWLAVMVRAAEPPVAGAGRARRDPALRRACAYLEEHLARNVSLDELAQASGASRFRLARLFRTGLGLPPHGYQLALRIAAARRALEAGASVTGAAAATGFADQAHLHRHFRRTLGITPARYAASFARTNVQDGGGGAR
jgi:AraC-like DNA-binding protein